MSLMSAQGRNTNVCLVPPCEGNSGTRFLHCLEHQKLQGDSVNVPMNAWPQQDLHCECQKCNRTTGGESGNELSIVCSLLFLENGFEVTKAEWCVLVAD